MQGSTARHGSLGSGERDRAAGRSCPDAFPASRFRIRVDSRIVSPMAGAETLRADPDPGS